MRKELLALPLAFSLSACGTGCGQPSPQQVKDYASSAAKDAVSGKLSEMSDKLDRSQSIVEGKLDNVKTTIETKLDALTTRVGSLEKVTDGLKRRIDGIASSFQEFRTSVEIRFSALESKLSSFITDTTNHFAVLESRVEKLEKGHGK